MILHSKRAGLYLRYATKELGLVLTLEDLIETRVSGEVRELWLSDLLPPSKFTQISCEVLQTNGSAFLYTSVEQVWIPCLCLITDMGVFTITTHKKKPALTFVSDSEIATTESSFTIRDSHGNTTYYRITDKAPPPTAARQVAGVQPVRESLSRSQIH